jgi:putative SOS response-associated peptidase YedK
MCGRFNITEHPLSKLLADISGQQMTVETRFNIAPTEQVPVLVKTGQSDWELHDMRWWLIPYWSKEPSNKYAMFNARSESLTKSSAFREPFRHRRCIMPVSGYYEWKTEGGVKVPYYIEPETDNGLAFAALWDRWRGDGQVVESCTIVTAAAPPAMQGIHNRIPIHLTPEQIDAWVSGDTDSATLQEILTPAIRTPLKITAMSTYVNNARNKDDRCIEPLGDTVLVH